MKMLKATQAMPVSDDVRARYSLVAPCLEACLYSVPRTWLDKLGEENISLAELADIFVAHQGDGDTGICFEYAVHDAIEKKHRLIWPLVSSVLQDFCGIGGGAESILFGPEKNGVRPVLKTAEQAFTAESRVLAGNVGQPAKLKKRIALLGDVHFKRKPANVLPASIRGLWRSDLFLGNPGPDRWVGVTVKSTGERLVGDAGLRIGIYPALFGRNDGPRVDETLNLIRLPLPYDGGFAELFSASWAIVRAFLRCKAREPTGAFALDLVYAPDKFVARELERRRDAPVRDVCEWLRRDSQRNLVQSVDLVDVAVQATVTGSAPGAGNLFPGADTTTLSPLPLVTES